MSTNRFNVFTTPRTSEEDNHEEISRREDSNINDLNRPPIPKSSGFSANAPIFVPRSTPIDTSQSAENFTIRPSVNHPTTSPTKKNGEANKKSPTRKDDWTVVKQKEAKFQSHSNRANFGIRENFDEKPPPVRWSCSRKKVLEGILAKRKVLIILRGPPGSGKSYLARSFINSNGIICNTDEYFMTTDKVYQFNPSRIEDAHRWNQQRAIRAMENRVTPVIIDNTNCQAWEMAPYVLSGIRNGYEIHFITPETPWAFDAKECARLNKHGVSYDRVVQMIERFDHNITLRTFTHGNCQKPIKPVVYNDLQVTAEDHSGQKRTANDDQDEYATSPRSKNQSVPTAVNDLSSWDEGEGDAQVSWGIANDYVPVSNEATTAVEKNSTLDSTTPKEQRSMAGTKKISLNSESFLTTSWGLPNDLTGGLLSTIGEKSNPFDVPIPSMIVDDRRIYVCDRQCQVNDKLIALSSCLRRRTSTSDGDPTAVAQVDLHTCYALVKPANQNLCCDKGIQADVGECDVQQTPLETLKCFFPSVSADDLSDILNNCDGDLTWATNVMLDTGHEMNWRLETSKSAEAIENLAEVDSPMSDLEGNLNDIQSEMSPVDDLQTKLPSDADTFEGESFHLMELSVDMASQLQQMFGRLHDDLPAELLSPQQMKIRLPFEIVAQLYQYWLNTQTEDPSQSVSYDADDVDDEVYSFDEFISAEELSDSMAPSSPRTIQQQMKMDELLARQLLEDEQQNYFAIESQKRPTPGDPTSLSTKLKYKKLTEMFPGVDQIVLSELFKANNYLLEPTMEVICQSFSIPANRKAQSSTSFATAFSTTPTPTSKRSQSASVPDDDDENIQYEQLRREAMDHYHKRKEYFQKAQDAYRCGQRPVASYYAQVGRVHDTKFKDANRSAAQKLLEHRKKYDPQDTLDLHGLHVPEAIAALAEKLKEYDKRPGKCLKIITGKGKHSDGRGPKIKPAVVAFLKQRKFFFSEVGSGLIQIQIK